MINCQTILLVEDEPQVREIMVEILSATGYHVLSAQDGKEALTISQQHDGPIVLLLTDVVMPGMDGKELAGHFRRERPEGQVLFVSAYARELIGLRDRLETGTAFLQKPFSVEGLIAKVHAVLDIEA